MRKSTLRLALLAATTVLAPAMLEAQPLEQQAGTAQGQGEQGASAGGDIVVTAQRRAQRFVDTAATISLATAEDLEASGIGGSRDLRLVTPSLNVTLFGPYVQPTIRGIGTTVLGVGADSNVATYIDGVYQASQIAGLFEFNNIDRIETLKGPQGSLYGRNATGGAIVVTTLAPSLDKMSVSAEASYARFDEIKASGYVNLPISSAIAVNFAIYNRSNDGYTRNVARNNEKSSITDSFGARARILVQPTDNLRFILSGTHLDQEDTTAFSYTPFNGNTPAPGTQAAFFGLNDHSRIAQNSPTNTDLNYDSVSLNAELSGHWGTLTSITSWTDIVAPYESDQDGTEANILSIRIPLNDQTTKTQEFLFVSPDYGLLTVTAGVFFLEDDSSSNFFVCSGAFCPTAFYPLTASSTQDTNAKAVFAEGEFDLTDRLHVTVGGRYSWERKKAQYRNGPGGFLMLDAKNSWEAFTPHGAVRYDLTEGSSVFASYSEGFKSGLFDALTTVPCVVAAPGPNCPSPGRPIAPEKVKAYEVGYKYSGGGIRLSAAAFFNDYKNIQITGRTPDGLLLLSNAAAAEIYGAELEINARFNEMLSVRGGATYTHGEYTDFRNAQVFLPLPSGRGNFSTSIDATGNDLIRTPEVTAFGSLNLKLPLFGGALENSLTVSHSSSYSWDPANRLKQPAYTILNGRITWVAPSEHWRVSVFLDNMTNEETMLYVRSSNTGDLVSYSKPRSLGVSAAVDF